MTAPSQRRHLAAQDVVIFSHLLGSVEGQRLLILLRYIETDIYAGVEALEANILDAKQVQSREFSGYAP